MVKVKKKTIKRAAKAADKRLREILKDKKPLELQFTKEWLLKKIDEDGDYECGVGWVSVPPRDPRLGAPRPVFGPSLLAHERRYKIKVEGMASIGKWGEEVNESYHRRVKQAVSRFAANIRYWWSL